MNYKVFKIHALTQFLCKIAIYCADIVSFLLCNCVPSTMG